MREELVALELLDHRGDAVVTTNSQVVSLRNIVSQHHARVLTDARKHGQQCVALERLRLIDNHEGIVQRTTTNMRERQDLENAAIHNMVENLFRNQGT